MKILPKVYFWVKVPFIPGLIRVTIRSNIFVYILYSFLKIMSCSVHAFTDSVVHLTSKFCLSKNPAADFPNLLFSSVQSLSRVWLFVTHESQHSRPPCPSPTPGVHSNSCPSSQWCHPAISSSVVPFSSCPQSLPASEYFPVSQLFSWGGQSTGVSALSSFFPKKSQGWSPSEWTGWISLQSKGPSRVFSNITVLKHQFFSAQPSSQSNSHIHTWSQEKP